MGIVTYNEKAKSQHVKEMSVY